MKNSTTMTVWAVGALLLTAAMALVYLLGTTEWDRKSEQPVVAEVRTEAAVETVKEVVPETNKIVAVDVKHVVDTGTVAGKFAE